MTSSSVRYRGRSLRVLLSGRRFASLLIGRFEALVAGAQDVASHLSTRRAWLEQMAWQGIEHLRAVVGDPECDAARPSAHQ